MTESLSYPIGRHVAKPAYSAAERAQLLDRLAAQPAAMAAVLDGLAAAAYERPYRPGGWTVRQLVHHVADSHLNMFIRVKFALTMDQPTIMPYDENAWAQLPDVAAVDPAQSVVLLTALHARIVAVFRALAPEQFTRGLLHPENGRMTVEQVLAMYAWHGDHHIAHIRTFREREGL
jgi:hypothetical protein